MSEKGVETDPDKIEALASWPEPDNFKALRPFLGFTGYYRRFVKDYVRMVKPLNDLLVGHPTHTDSDSKKKKKYKKISPWQWVQHSSVLSIQLRRNYLLLLFWHTLILASRLFCIPMLLQKDFGQYYTKNKKEWRG